MRLIRRSCVCLLVLFVIFNSTVKANETDSLRLFHDPSPGAVNDETPSTEQVEKTADEDAGVAINEAADAEDVEDVEDDTAKRNKRRSNSNLKLKAYHYNGYIKTTKSISYFVNGMSIHQLGGLALVAVKGHGKALRLKTAKGKIFTLTIGETKILSAHNHVNDKK